MKLSTTLPVLSLMLFIGAGANAACVYPQAPQTIPNGGKATKEEMLATQSEIKAYRAAVEETYLPCLEQEKSESLAALDGADPELAAEAGDDRVHARQEAQCGAGGTPGGRRALERGTEGLQRGRQEVARTASTAAPATAAARSDRRPGRHLAPLYRW